jgi:hypothetical protein
LHPKKTEDPVTNLQSFAGEKLMNYLLYQVAQHIESSLQALYTTKVTEPWIDLIDTDYESTQV